MKQLTRSPAPACLATDDEERSRIQRERYEKTHYPSGGWRALWNELDRDESGVSAARRALLAMSADECAYCGLWIGNDHMQVDHILPKEAFPFVAYAWENLLPTCDACNRRKLAFVPPSLIGKTVVEPCLEGSMAHDIVFRKPHVFLEIARDDRLVDPSFDNPDEHIDVLMDIPTYRPKSSIGEITYKRFFRHPEVTCRLAKVREAARVVIEAELGPEGLSAMAMVSSHPSLFYRFVEYWRAAQREGLFTEALKPRETQG